MGRWPEAAGGEPHFPTRSVYHCAYQAGGGLCEGRDSSEGAGQWNRGRQQVNGTAPCTPTRHLTLVPPEGGGEDVPWACLRESRAQETPA
jgi:hypothetical protein